MRPHHHGWPGHHEWQARWWDPEVQSARYRSRSTPAFRLWAPVILSFLVMVPPIFVVFTRGEGLHRVAYASWQEALLQFAIGIIGPLALIGARRFPGPVVAVVAVAASVDLLLAAGQDGPPYIAFAFAIGSAIVRGARVWAWAAIAASWVGTLVLGFSIGISWQPYRVLGISFGILLIVAIAEGFRTRSERYAAAMARVSARRQSEVQAERVRIARELHDVLAHSLSQINVQAGVGLHLLERQPEKAADALASIKETSKSALDEVRSVLGILRDGHADAPLVPEPDLSRLDGLVASVIAQGVDVTLSGELTEVPKPTQLALYRIVQESLTNVVRHANATLVRVELVETAASYVATITDNGTGTAEKSAEKSEGGRGLLGMHERAELLGGTLQAGRSDSGFTVTATIPKAEKA
jgi:signal transduction histidine kinase